MQQLIIILLSFQFIKSITLKIGGLAIGGSTLLMNSMGPTFRDYLTAASNNTITFELVSLDFSTTYTAVQNKSIDFVYTNPSVHSCLESEYGASAIASLNTLRMSQELASFGGVIFALKNRTDINQISDIKDRVVEAVSISGLGGCQMQWKELYDRNLEFLNDPREVRFSYNQKKIVQDVIKGSADIGFVRTDFIEDMVAKNEIQDNLLKILEPKDLGANSTFPFQTSTSLYPEWSLTALPHVTPDMQKFVSEALFKIKKTDACALAGNYAGWVPPLSYLLLNEMQRSLGWISDKGICIKSDLFYEAIVCPPNHLKMSQSEMSTSCVGVNTTACPTGYDCICKPCQKVPNITYTSQIKGIASLKNEEQSRLEFKNCTKLNSCLQLQIYNRFLLQIEDNLFTFREKLGMKKVQSAQVKYHGQSKEWISIQEQKDQLGNSMGKYQIEFDTSKEGTYLIEIQVDGQQIDESPFYIIIEPEAPIDPILIFVYISSAGILISLIIWKLLKKSGVITNQHLQKRLKSITQDFLEIVGTIVMDIADMATDIFSCIQVWESTDDLILAYKEIYLALTIFASLLFLYTLYELFKALWDLNQQRHHLIDQNLQEDSLLEDIKFSQQQIIRKILFSKHNLMMGLVEDLPFIIFNSIFIFIHNFYQKEIIVSQLISCIILGIKLKEFLFIIQAREHTNQQSLIIERLANQINQFSGEKKENVKESTSYLSQSDVYETVVLHSKDINVFSKNFIDFHEKKL